MKNKKAAKKKKKDGSLTAAKRTADEASRIQEVQNNDGSGMGILSSKRNILAVFFSALCSLVLIIVLLLTSVEYNSFNLGFYKTEYAKLNSAQTIGISDEELLQTTKDLLTYIKGKRADLDMEATIKGEKRQVFNEREKTHMVDVRNLYIGEHTCKNIGIALFLLFMMITYKISGKQFVRILGTGYLIAFSVCLALLLFIIFMIAKDFTAFWTQFHQLFFTNDLWQLDPATDILIQMMPEQLFSDLVSRILRLFIIETIILAIMSFIAVKKLNPEKTA
ncbi:MAG: TIGR01906 family membrane protein [Peptococcaceae bacterium]|nr:TIGR01906 family membrane protein [Peptococcaceae bacterium]